MSDLVSYSNRAEDLLAWEYFGRKTDGFFLEVGANEPDKLSQTLFLEQRGWKGILVEPQRDCCERLRQRRAGSQVFQVACGAPAQKGKALFHIAKSNTLSTLARNRISDDVEYVGTEEVELLPLDEVLERAGSPRLDFVSIDVEGTEIDVMRGFSIEKHRPPLLVIEDHVQSLDLHRHIKRRGYQLVKRTDCNSWYVPKGAAFPLATFGDRWEIFRKLHLGTPLRRLKRFLRHR